MTETCLNKEYENYKFISVQNVISKLTGSFIVVKEQIMKKYSKTLEAIQWVYVTFPFRTKSKCTIQSKLYCSEMKPVSSLYMEV